MEKTNLPGCTPICLTIVANPKCAHLTFKLKSMKPSKLIFIALFSLVIWQINFAQSVNPKLDSLLSHTLDSMHQVLRVKGLAAALRLPNGAIWADGAGISTENPLDSIDADHAFAVASVTKTIAAACILQLVDEGKLHLDDSLHQWLDTFPFINPNITIRQLLRHQSGIYDVLQNPSFQPQLLTDVNRLWDFEDIIRVFIRAPAFQPGARWAYSNTNYLLLGMIIEAATGNSYLYELKKRFFEPLGLHSLSQPAYDPLPAEVAHLWLDITNDGQLDDAHLFFTGWHSFFSAIGTAGAYFSTPTDMAKWMHACMNGNFYSPSIWAEATTTVSTGLPGGTRYGLGLMERNFLGLKGYGHGGDVSYSSSVFYFPEKDISIAVHANDASINSWSLAPTVTALLRTYLECESLISDAREPEWILPDFEIFPNPFTDRITATLKTNSSEPLNFKITLTTADGENIATAKPEYSGQTVVFNDLQNLPQGFYFLNAVSERGQVKTFKLAKVN